MSCGFHSIADEDCSVLGYDSLSIGNMLPMVCRRLLPPAYGGQRSVGRWENLVELCREVSSRRGGIAGWMESYVEPPVCKESRVWQWEEGAVLKCSRNESQLIKY